MKLYIGDLITTITTLSVLCLIGYMVYTILHRSTIHYWGRRTVLLFILGLIICCLAATRDGLDKTIQYTIDQSCLPGLFSLISIPNIIGCIGAVLIMISLIATPLSHSQSMRAFWFYMMTSGIMLKVIIIEISRIIVG